VTASCRQSVVRGGRKTTHPQNSLLCDKHADFLRSEWKLTGNPDFRQNESVSRKFCFTNIGDRGIKKGLRIFFVPLSASFGAPIAFWGSVIPRRLHGRHTAPFRTYSATVIHCPMSHDVAREKRNNISDLA
jgi:hypothetical protein